MATVAAVIASTHHPFYYRASTSSGPDRPPFADEVGLDPVVVVGKGDEAIPSVRHPIRFSATPASYRLPPPSLDQHGEEIRRWLAEPEAEA